MDVDLQTNTHDPTLGLRNVRRLDANTFECNLFVRSNGFAADRPFSFEEPDLRQFVARLHELERVLRGSAELRMRYETDFVRVEVGPRGNVLVSGMLRHYGTLAQSLSFAFETDQTVLMPFASDLARVQRLPSEVPSHT